MFSEQGNGNLKEEYIIIKANVQLYCERVNNGSLSLTSLHCSLVRETKKLKILLGSVGTIGSGGM